MIARAACAALAIALSGCVQPMQRAEPPSHHVIVGYVAGWENPAPGRSPSASKAMDGRERPPIDAEKLSAINYAFARIAGGAVVVDQARANEAFPRLRALKERNPDLKILVSVGGWGADGFSDAAQDEASRAKFAQSAAVVVSRYQLDGVDLDWEYPGLPGPGIRHREADKHNFTLLLEAVRRRLDALGARLDGHTHYLLTAALADGDFAGHVELDGIHGYLDWINLMTYDFHNSLTKTTGHHAALSASATSATDERSIERAVAQYLAAGVPAGKLIVGVPFYGRVFADVQAKNNGLDQPYGRYEGDYPWPKLVSDFIGRNGFVRYWDNKAKAPYLWNAQTRTFISYDDPQSLALKAGFVKSHKLGGMMYWEQSQDPEGELLGVLAKSLGPPRTFVSFKPNP